MGMPVDLLDSDIGLFELHSTRTNSPDGSVTAALRDTCYPDGWDEGPIQGRLVGNNRREIVIAWHNFVRGKLRAWEDRKEAEAFKRAEASGTDSFKGPEPSGELVASKASSQEVVASSEGSLEELLESKVAALRRSVASIEAEIEGTDAALRILRERRNDIIRERQRAEKALVAVTTGRIRKKKNESTGVRGKGVQQPSGSVPGPERATPAGDNDNPRRGKRSRQSSGGLGPAQQGTGSNLSG